MVQFLTSLVIDHNCQLCYIESARKANQIEDEKSPRASVTCRPGVPASGSFFLHSLVYSRTDVPASYENITFCLFFDTMCFFAGEKMRTGFSFPRQEVPPGFSPASPSAIPERRLGRF